ncbi:MAG TPA: hypothetical protein VHT70_03355 [Candidatus Saccharimonadales bacterium]|nr:hypothetical protein [Candidatus Saccharimonadales bacterium]
MGSYYLEIRKQPGSGAGLATDIAKHLQRRQHLGTAVVVSDRPLNLMCVVRKFWMKLARALQRERAGTVNAQKILHLTYAVTRMQHLTFIAKTPAQIPDADIYFVSPHQLSTLPVNCYSIYITEKISEAMLANIVAQLASKALIIDYTDSIASTELMPLQPKTVLVDQVTEAWEAVRHFLASSHIDIATVAEAVPLHAATPDDALDVLLDQSRGFLQVASEFHRCLQLAQPFDPPHETQKLYNTLSLLAHRVQALSTGQTTPYLESLPDTFFLRDDGANLCERKKRLFLAAAAVWHEQCGRLHLSKALKALSASPHTSATTFDYEAVAMSC